MGIESIQIKWGNKGGGIAEFEWACVCKRESEREGLRQKPKE